MTVAAVAIGSFLLLLVVAYLIARPLLAPELPVDETEEWRTSKLLEDKERLLAEIRELDMDFATGKLTQDDYGKLRSRTLAEAAATMQAIAEAPDRAPREREEPAEEPVPALGPLPKAGQVPIEDELEGEIAARKRALEEHACPGCGAGHDPHDRFCRLCGAQLAAAGTG